MHLPDGPVIFGDERGQNDARRELGLEHFDRSGKRVAAEMPGQARVGTFTGEENGKAESER